MSGARIDQIGSVLQIKTGHAALVLWRSTQVATGAYVVRGVFALALPSRVIGSYGLFLGGRNLDNDNQEYTYFVIRQTGEYMIKRRSGEVISDLRSITAHPSIAKLEGDGPSVNRLEVRVGKTEVRFLVNEQLIHAAPKAKGESFYNGIWGVRVNRLIPSLSIDELGSIAEFEGRLQG